MTPRPLRFAFSHISRRLWAGGYNYQRNLFAALDRFLPGEFVPVVFAGTGAEENEIVELAAVPGVEIVRSEAFDGQPGLAAALALGLDRAAAAGFHSARVDVVVEAARFFGWRLPVPAVAWILICSTGRCPSCFQGRHAGAARSAFAFRSPRGEPSC